MSSAPPLADTRSFPRPSHSLRPGAGSLVIALSDKDLGRFFPDGFPTTPERWGTVLFETPKGAPPEQWAARLRDLNASVLVSAWSTPSLRAFATAPETCPLSYVCHLAGSVRQLVPASLIDRGLLVTNWGALVAAQVAEHALLLVLSALRDQPAWTAGLRPDAWQRGLQTRMLRGKRVGIFGFGGIARELAALLRPFGVEVTAWSAGVPASLMREHGVRPAASLEDLFAGSEILVSCEALTPATGGAVSRGLLARLPDHALFVNIARGALVDQAALEAEALSGRIRVALDVYASEPLPADSPLRSIPGAVLSPHIAGPTGDAHPLIGKFAVDNLHRYFSGRTPEAVITAGVYARST